MAQAPELKAEQRATLYEKHAEHAEVSCQVTKQGAEWLKPYKIPK